MPPPANQGSRAALVTWTVVTAILFVTATVFAIYFYVDSTKVAELAKTNAGKYSDVIDDSALSTLQNDPYGLVAAKSSPNAAAMNVNQSMKLLEVAVEQRNALAKLIAGTPGADPGNAYTIGNTAMTQAAAANKAAQGSAFAPSSLVDSITALTTTLKARKAEVDALKADRDTVAAAQKKKDADTANQLDAMNKTIDGIRAEQAAAVAQVSTVSAGKDDQIKQIQGQSDDQAKVANDAQVKLQTQVTDGQRKIEALEKQLAVLNDRLGTLRVDPTRPILSQGDGHVVRVPGGPNVFIDLGYGDHITPGLTFEVYDKLTGIPPAGDPTNDDNLPVGKASIEVTNVGATSSECRVTKTEPGTAISEGDIIANLVYDKNTKYNFVVFGNFNLAHTGTAEPQDAEVIKRLITQWGGTVVTDINVNTDFVILGAEPEIPSFTKDELANDPLIKAKYDQAVADAGAYDDIKEKALGLRIPILNQNRFLYLCGYYDQAAK
jgi:hypothetical protein